MMVLVVLSPKNSLADALSMDSSTVPGPNNVDMARYLLLHLVVKIHGEHGGPPRDGGRD